MQGVKDQQDVSYKSYARIPNLILYGMPDLCIQEKWALASLVGMCLNRQKDGKPPLKDLEGPYKMSLRDIEKVTGVSYSVLRTYGKKTERRGVLDNLQAIGYVTFIDAYPIDAQGKVTKRAQTYLYVHLEKIWTDNVGIAAPTGTLVNPSTFNIVSNTDNTESIIVSITNNTVSSANGIVSDTDNVTPYIVSNTNDIVSTANNGKSNKPSSQAASYGIFEVPNTVKTITSNTRENNNNTGKATAIASARLPFDSSSDEKKEETKKRSTIKNKLATLETFDFEQLATIENIMKLGDCWRGGPLQAIKRADSDYQRALLQGATPLSQRQRQNGKKGYTLREIDTAYRFYRRIPPDSKPWLIADDWWIGKNVDLWVISKNIDKALASIANLEKQHGNQSSPEQSSQDNEPVLWTKHVFQGSAESHWWLFEYMPLEEAFKFNYIQNILAKSVEREIDDNLELYKAGKLQLPKEAYATVA